MDFRSKIVFEEQPRVTYFSKKFNLLDTIPLLRYAIVRVLIRFYKVFPCSTPRSVNVRAATAYNLSQVL